MTSSALQASLAHLMLVLSLALPGQQRPAQPRPINDRNTVVKVLIGGSRGLYDGSFEMTGRSGICGEVPKEASITGEAVFVVEFPVDPPANGPINALAFGSKQLVGGVTKAKIFRLSVGVVTARGGKPPAFVLNSDTPNMGSGDATLTSRDGVATLKVVGRDERGATIDLATLKRSQLRKTKGYSFWFRKLCGLKRKSP